MKFFEKLHYALENRIFPEVDRCTIDFLEYGTDQLCLFLDDPGLKRQAANTLRLEKFQHSRWLTQRRKEVIIARAEAAKNRFFSAFYRKHPWVANAKLTRITLGESRTIYLVHVLNVDFEKIEQITERYSVDCLCLRINDSALQCRASRTFKLFSYLRSSWISSTRREAIMFQANEAETEFFNAVYQKHSWIKRLRMNQRALSEDPDFMVVQILDVQFDKIQTGLKVMGVYGYD